MVGAVGNDPADVVLETSIQHTVSLVEDEVLDSREVEITSIGEVKSTTGGADNDADAVGADLGNLLHLGHSTKESHRADTETSAELDEGVVALLSELTSGSEDEHGELALAFLASGRERCEEVHAGDTE